MATGLNENNLEGVWKLRGAMPLRTSNICDKVEWANLEKGSPPFPALWREFKRQSFWAAFDQPISFVAFYPWSPQGASLLDATARIKSPLPRLCRKDTVWCFRVPSKADSWEVALIVDCIFFSSIFLVCTASPGFAEHLCWQKLEVRDPLIDQLRLLPAVAGRQGGWSLFLVPWICNSAFSANLADGFHLTADKRYLN